MDITFLTVNKQIIVENKSLPFSKLWGVQEPPQLSYAWLNELGNFEVGLVRASGKDDVNVATVNGIFASNVHVSGGVYTETVGKTAGYVARYSAGNFYLGAYSRTDAGYVASIWLCFGGAWTRLASADIAGGDSYAGLRFEVVGNSLRLFRGSEIVAYAYDSTLSTGKIGMLATKGASLDGLTSNVMLMNSNGSAVPFNDSFNNQPYKALDTSWTNRTGMFQIVNDVAKGMGAANLATVNGISVGNVVVQSEFTVSAAGQYAGLVARYSGPGDNNLYCGGITNTGNGYTAAIWLRNNGVWTQLGGAAVSSPGIGLLRFEVAGTSLKLFLDDVQVVVANDSTLTTGYVGMRSTAGARFDNFSAPFFDNFNVNGSLSNKWTTAFGQFSVESNQAKGGQSFNVAIVTGSSLSDVAVQATVSLDTGEFAGLVARHTGPADENMYAGFITRSNNTYMAWIYRKEAGAFNLLAFQQLAGIGNGVLKFQVVGDSLKLYLDDIQVVSATDSTFDSGAVGIYSNSGAMLDNFSAT